MALNLEAKLLIFPLLTLLSATTAFTSEDEEWRSATATYIKSTYSSTLTGGAGGAGGACGYRNLTEYRYSKVAAVSKALFGQGEACGACYQVRCVDHILWCLQGSPSVVVTATDYCAPNYALPGDYGGWCNYPLRHFDMSMLAFVTISVAQADIVPIQYRRVKCERYGGMRFTVTGSLYFFQVLITNVASDGEVTAVKVKGGRTGWIQMGRNWGQNWQCNAEFEGQALSFEVRNGGGRTVTSYNVVPSDWRFGRTYQGKQFEH